MARPLFTTSSNHDSSECIVHFEMQGTELINFSKAFEEKVFAAVRKIPEGKWTTYKKVADHAGHPGASRAVGSILKNNPYTESNGCEKSMIVPCHRVVGADRKLRGFFGDTNPDGGLKRKRELLESEGCRFVKDRVCNECKHE